MVGTAVFIKVMVIKVGFRRRACNQVCFHLEEVISEWGAYGPLAAEALFT